MDTEKISEIEQINYLSLPTTGRRRHLGRQGCNYHFQTNSGSSL